MTESLSLRAGPNTGDAVLLLMPAGASVSLTGEAQNGYEAVSYQGTNGWAASAYLNKTGASGAER